MVAKPGRQGNTGGKSELFNRLMFVIIGLVVFRFGSFIPVPGINTDVLEKCLNPRRQRPWDVQYVFRRCFVSCVHFSLRYNALYLRFYYHSAYVSY